MTAPTKEQGLRRPGEWFSLRGGRGLGMLAYMGMRLSGILLVVYLYLHLAILKQLADGPAAWNGFVALAKTPAFLALDVLLIAGILAHGLNGLRLVLLALGVGLPGHKAMLVTAGVLTVVVTLASVYAIFFLGG